MSCGKERKRRRRQLGFGCGIFGAYFKVPIGPFESPQFGQHPLLPSHRPASVVHSRTEIVCTFCRMQDAWGEAKASTRGNNVYTLSLECRAKHAELYLLYHIMHGGEGGIYRVSTEGLHFGTHYHWVSSVYFCSLGRVIKAGASPVCLVPGPALTTQSAVASIHHVSQGRSPCAASDGSCQLQ